MTDPEFISIRAAADLAGVSKKTIERAYKKYLKDNDLTLESATDILQIEQQGSRRQYFISEAFVRNTLMKEGSGPARKTSNSADDALISQLQSKDEQLRTANEHIGALTERLKDAQQSLQAEQALHLNTQEKRRPLLAFRSNETVNGQSRRPQLQWRRIVGVASVGMSAVVLGIAIWLITYL